MFELAILVSILLFVGISGRGFLVACLLAVAFRELAVAGPGQMWIDVACDPSRATEILEVEISTRN